MFLSFIFLSPVLDLNFKSLEGGTHLNRYAESGKMLIKSVGETMGKHC